MFIELQPGEVVLAVLRKHYVLFLAKVSILLFLFIVPFILSMMSFSFPFISSGTATFFGALWMLVLFVQGFIIWTKYYLDVWIVTNIRLVDIEQLALFNRKSSTLELEHIEDITVKIEGFTESMIGYGTLSVQTAGHIQEFVINDITNPEQAKQIIYDAQHKTKEARHERIVESGLPRKEQIQEEEAEQTFHAKNFQNQLEEIPQEGRSTRTQVTEERYNLED